MNLVAKEYTFKNLGKINVIVGKNGCGKSRCLRRLDQVGKSDPESALEKSYITPERGGHVKWASNIDQAMGDNPNYLPDDRRKNQSGTFKAQSVSQFRRLSSKVLWKLNQAVGVAPEGDLLNLKLDHYLEDINSLLDHIEIEYSESMSFIIKQKGNGQKIEPDKISSGESELIALSIECLAFEASNIEKASTPILILDEPEVHLHPDLQLKLIGFFKKICDRSKVRIIVSTHSTVILSALAGYNEAKIFFMKHEDKDIEFKPISLALQSLLPVFGAHPLTAIFNEAPVFIVEGTDEERIWQQAFRTSLGKVKIFPVVAGDLSKLSTYEAEANTILGAVYESARGYSLRDGDDNSNGPEPDDLDRVVRFRLHCYSSENLILTDEVLAAAGTNWTSIETAIEDWLLKYSSHPYFESMKKFKESGYDRKAHKIKNIRNILISFFSPNKSWEISVGQTIGRLSIGPTQQYSISNSIYTFLGKKLCESILPRLS